MGFLNKLVDSAEYMVRGLSDFFGRSVSSYCDLESATPNGDHILMAKDGTCISILQWNGTRMMVGSEEFESIVDHMNRTLQTSFYKTGHTIQVCFGCERTPEHASKVLDNQFSGMVSAAKKLQLSVEDVLRDRRNALVKHCAPEYCFIALMTSRAVLAPQEWKSENDRHRAKTAKLPRGKRAQNYVASPQAIIDTHRSFVEFFLRDLKAKNQDAKILDARGACRAIRKMVDEEFTAEDWSPLIPGDFVPAHEDFGADKYDLSYLMWPPLPAQLVPRDPVIEDYKTVRIGDRIWSPLVINIPQKTATPFQELFSRMRSVEVPWRVTVSISGDGLADTGFKQSLASALGVAGKINTEIAEVFKGLKDLKEKGETIVSLRIVAATWAKVGDKPKLAENAARLARALQSWGGCDVGEIVGNPAAGFFCTVPGFRLTSVAEPSNLLMRDALGLLPWHRPASPWDDGNFLWRTPDGKPYPYAAYSGKQDAWITLIVSPMGGGKSVLMNGLNLGLILDKNNDYLPLIRILDVGPSSSGLTSLISAALPKGKEYESQYHRILNTPQYAWNPCDTPLGQRYPLSSHRDFLISLLCMLCTPLDADAPQEGISGIAGMVVDATYKKFADENTSAPRFYSRNSNLAVDDAVDRHGISTDERTTWWELEDTFFKLGDIRAAYNAHRYAMPLMSEMASQAMDDTITKLYADRTAGGIGLCEFFRRKLIEAVQQYRILSEPTRFDLGDASIVSLDLDEVARRGSPSALRQTTVMYLMSLWLLSNDFFIGPATLPEITPLYQDYHLERIKRLRRVKKRLCADEFHRPVESSKSAVEMITQIIREGRKWSIDVLLASQRHEDFPPAMVDLASCIYVMKPPSTGSASMVDVFKLSRTEQFTVDNYLLGPQAGVGANCLARYITKDGNTSHLLTNTPGGIEMWAFSTTAEDRDVRDTLYKEMAPSKARRILAKRFSGGSCKSEIDRRQQARVNSGVTITTSVIDEMINEFREIARNEPD